MLIVLDTNVIISDLLIRKTGFEILKDYAMRTDSQIVVPRIVLEELTAHYRRVVEAGLEVHNGHADKLNRLLLQPAASRLAVDLDVVVEEYVKYVRISLGITDARILEYREPHLRDAIARAVTRRRPCTESGNEVRDSLLWSCVLDYAESAGDSVVLISQNTKQFAQGGELHPALAEEVAARNVRVEYVSTLEEFAKKHAARIAFVTSEWIEGEIGGDYVLDDIRDTILDAAQDAVGGRWRSNAEDFRDFEIASAYLEVSEFFVYVMSNGEMRLQVQWFGAAEVEYTARADYGFDSDYPSRIGSRVDLRVSATTEGTIRDGHVPEWAVVDGSAVGDH